MIEEYILEADEKMDKTIQVYGEELNTIRAGRANPHVLDRIRVDYYGVPTPLGQVGNVTIPEPRMIVINVWDKGMLKEVEKALLKSDLGINPTNDGKVIRLVFPDLTEERRKNLVKQIHKLAEKAKVAVRAIRRDVNTHLKTAEKTTEITEDDLEDYEKDVQEMTDNHTKRIEKITKDKETEIMEV